jgi:hypothetical protein
MAGRPDALRAFAFESATYVADSKIARIRAEERLMISSSQIQAERWDCVDCDDGSLTLSGGQRDDYTTGGLSRGLRMRAGSTRTRVLGPTRDLAGAQAALAGISAGALAAKAGEWQTVNAVLGARLVDHSIGLRAGGLSYETMDMTNAESVTQVVS